MRFAFLSLIIRFYKVSLSICLALALGLVVAPSEALAWKPTTHVYLGQQALNDALQDGKVTIPQVDYESGEIIGEIGTYQVDREIMTALRSNTAQYRAGILGPDAYPDLLTGQQVIHPDPSDTGVKGGSNSWLNYLWERSESASKPPVKAFTVGYLTHAAGDMFGHTFINHFTGGPFVLLPPDNAIKHIIVEGYTDKRLNASELNADFFNASISGVEKFIYDNMVDAKPGTKLDRELLLSKIEGTNNSATDFSIPRIFSTLRANLEGQIQGYYQERANLERKADACRWYDPTCYDTAKLNAFKLTNGLIATYEEAWRDDIDTGLKKWPVLSHEVAKALFFNQNRKTDTDRAQEILENYAKNDLLLMAGAPKVVVLAANVVSDIISIITPDFLIEPIRQLKEDLLNTMLKAAIGMDKQELKKYLTSPDKYFDEVLTRGPGTNVTLKKFNSDYLHIQDPGYTNPSEAFDYRQVPAAYNTVLMSKLILLPQNEVNRLLKDLKSSEKLTEKNIMLGFIRSLDDSNQWANSMVVAKDCNAYQQIFMKQPGEIGGCSA